jgi:hypothetical protein
LPEFPNNVSSVQQTIDYLLPLPNSKELAVALVESFQLLDDFRFNIRYIFKIVQRVAITMSYNQPDFFITAFSAAVVSVVSDPYENDNENLTKVRDLIGKVAQLCEVSAPTDAVILSNINSVRYRPIHEFQDFQKLSESRIPSVKVGMTLTKIWNLWDIIVPENNWENFVRYANLLTTPYTHLLIKDDQNRALPLILEMTSALKIPYTMYEIGNDITAQTNDLLVRAGREKCHCALIVDERHLDGELLLLLEHLMEDPFGIEPKEVLKIICAEQHIISETFKGPFREEILEGQENYPVL